MSEKGHKRARSFLKIFSRKQDVMPVSMPSSQKQRGQLLPPNSKSAELPREIHDCIIRSLRRLHENRRQPTCSTCLTRDLSSYSLVCKKWHEAAIPHLYKKVTLNGPESNAQVKKYKRSQRETTRAAKLVKTLTARPDYASHVRELKLPQFNRETLTRAEVLDYLEFAASTVKLCPNLERVLGLYTRYGGWSSALHQALATRSNLREQVFMFEDHVEEQEVLKPEKLNKFVQLFENWSNLETLVLFGTNQAPGVDFVAAFTKLPKLKSLMIANFELGGSDALSIQAIPASVEDIRLEDISGLSDSSLVSFARSRSYTAIHSLYLINIGIGKVQTLEHFFKIPNLRRLTISDNKDVPYFEGDDDGEIQRQENRHLVEKFTSESLQYLHWDILCTQTVEKALADAISSGFLPSLRLLRAPSDRTGALQAVCKPLEAIATPGDYVFEASFPNNPRSPPSRMRTANSANPPLMAFISSSAPHSRRASVSSRRASVSSYRSSTFSSTCSNQSSTSAGTAFTNLTVPIPVLKPLGKPSSVSRFQPFPRTLPSARLRAQRRIDRARQDIKLQIVIEDTDTKAKETISLRGFIGNVRSKVVYTLQPDIKTLGLETSEHGDALVRLERDVVDREWKRECLVTPAIVHEICTGTWNIREVVKAGSDKKKQKCVGAHIERRKVEISTITVRDLFL